MGFYFFDYRYFLWMLPAILLTVFAQLRVQSAYRKYAGIRCARGYTGAQAAERVAYSGGARNIGLQQIGGVLSDHYDPRTNVIRLSSGVYGGTSIASVSVAAHEAGHSIQYATGYAPIKLRALLVPVTQFGSRLAVPLILIGLLLPVQYSFLVNLGIAFYALAVLFQLVTLPVEFNASRRALRALREENILLEEELPGAKAMLSAAALTYLAACLTALLQLLRLLTIAGRRNQR